MNRRFVLLSGIAIALVAVAVLARPPAAAPSDAAAAVSPAVPVPLAAPATARPAARQEVHVPPAPRPRFEEYFERLVELGVQMAQALDAGDEGHALALDAQARALLQETLRRVEEPAGAALFHLTGLLVEDTTLAGQVRRRVCTTLIEEQLLLWQRGGAARRIELLVRDLLRTIPQEHAFLDELGFGLLVDRSWLGGAHEADVMEFAAAAGDDPTRGRLASALLLTLWRNLEASGARTPAELAGLAMLWQEDSDPNLRAAALQKLATVQNGRYRDLVVDNVLRARDRVLAPAVAQALAAQAPPQAALRAVERLLPLLGAHASAPLLALAQRAPQLLAQQYEQRLAGGVDAALRAELVTGCAFAGGPPGIEVARTAFAADPDPDVRMRALFGLTAQATAALGEPALIRALEDPQVKADPRRLGQVVLAFANLAQGGDPNAVARVGRLLQARRELLSPGDRATLDDLLARHLPR